LFDFAPAAFGKQARLIANSRMATGLASTPCYPLLSTAIRDSRIAVNYASTQPVRLGSAQGLLAATRLAPNALCYQGLYVMSANKLGWAR